MRQLFLYFFVRKTRAKRKTDIYIKYKEKERSERKMRKKRITAVLALGAVMMGMLTACGSGALTGSRSTVSGIPIVGKSTDIESCVTVAAYDIPESITYTEGTEEEALSEAKARIWEQIENSSTFSGIPADVYEKYEEEYEKNCLYVSGCDSIGQYLDFLGISREDYEELQGISSENNSKEEILLSVVAKDLGIKEESKEYKDAYVAFVEGTGMKEEEVKEQYGENLIKRTVLYETVMDELTKDCTLVKETS